MYRIIGRVLNEVIYHFCMLQQWSRWESRILYMWKKLDEISFIPYTEHKVEENCKQKKVQNFIIM